MVAKCGAGSNGNGLKAFRALREAIEIEGEEAQNASTPVVSCIEEESIDSL